MKRLLVILILGMLGCKKDLPIQIQTINKIVDTIPIVQFKEFTFSGLSVNHMGYDINAPIFIDYDGNGKLDMILSQRKQQRIGNIYTYDLLNPIVILENGQKEEIKNLWKGGYPVATGDFNGDGFMDVVEMDNGPEYWDLNPLPYKTPLTVYWGNKMGLTAEKTIVDSTILTYNVFGMNTGDIDADGKDEIFRYDPDNNYYKYVDGKFIKVKSKSQQQISALDYVGDLNNDQKSDGIEYKWGKITILFDLLNYTNQKIVLNLPDSMGVDKVIVSSFFGKKDIILICQKQPDASSAPIEHRHYFLYYKNENNNFILDESMLPKYVEYKYSGNPTYLAKDYDKDGDIDFYNANIDTDAIFINQNGKLIKK